MYFVAEVKEDSLKFVKIFKNKFSPLSKKKEVNEGWYFLLILEA